jgi:hypothetical protein
MFWYLMTFFVAKQFSNRLISFVLQKLELVNNEKVRIAALSIVRHLVNVSGEC